MRDLDGALDDVGAQTASPNREVHVDGREDLRVGGRPFGLEPDIAPSNVHSAAFQNQYHVVSGAGTRPCQDHFHRPRPKIAPTPLDCAVHDHGMTAAGFGHKAHPTGTAPAHVTFHSGPRYSVI